LLIADFPWRADWVTMPRSVGLPVELWLTFSACNATIVPEQVLLIVVFLSAPFGWRRSRWQGLCVVVGFGSSQDYPVVAAGLGAAALTQPAARPPLVFRYFPIREYRKSRDAD
jgi:hypothetical protein